MTQDRLPQLSGVMTATDKGKHTEKQTSPSIPPRSVRIEFFGGHTKSRIIRGCKEAVQMFADEFIFKESDKDTVDLTVFKQGERSSITLYLHHVEEGLVLDIRCQMNYGPKFYDLCDHISLSLPFDGAKIRVLYPFPGNETLAGKDIPLCGCSPKIEPTSLPATAGTNDDIQPSAPGKPATLLCADEYVQLLQSNYEEDRRFGIEHVSQKDPSTTLSTETIDALWNCVEEQGDGFSGSRIHALVLLIKLIKDSGKYSVRGNEVVCIDKGAQKLVEKVKMKQKFAPGLQKLVEEFKYLSERCLEYISSRTTGIDTSVAQKSLDTLVDTVPAI